jgi:hypothetical protein
MIDQSASDIWKKMAINPENDPIQNNAVHLIMVESDIGRAYANNIDDDRW